MSDEKTTSTNEPGTDGMQDAAQQAAAPQAESTDQQVATLKDLLLRKAAEFENYKKRTESDMSSVIRLANEGLVLAFLPIVDDLERSLKAAKDHQDAASLTKGIELIHQKLQKVLDAQGVKVLETVGKPFDVHYHDAMLQIPRADVPDHTIVEEVEKGYSMNGKVIRHAKVIVSMADNASADPSGTRGGSEGEASA